MRLPGTISAAILGLLLLSAGTAGATSLQPVGEFDEPIYVTSAPGDPNRLFVVERQGKIVEVENGSESTFADLEAVVGCCAQERGLLSVAFAPDFGESGRLFVFYTGSEESPGEIHVAELTASGSSAPIGTLRNLLTIPHPEDSNHYGGQLQFGPDGDLYISTGDGGGADDEHHTAQDLGSALGKILRIDPDPDGGSPYTVPPDNPFAGAGYPAETIWSYGLRNPFRFSFDRLSGAMTIADVGQSAREEVDFAPSPAPGLVGGGGANYGWNCREGFLPGPGDDLPLGECALTGFVEPIFDYPHTPDPELGGSERCAITGGYVVRDPTLGALNGHYVYADYCSGVLRALQPPVAPALRAEGDCSLGLELESPISFGEDSAGRLYVVEEAGRVSRLVGPPPATCPAPFVPPPTEPPEARPPQNPTFVGIKAQRRRVERGKAALLTVWVSPCEGRKGDTVKLLRDGRPNGSRYLSRACTARFLPRVRRGTTFVAVTGEEREYLPGESRRLRIRLAHRRPR